ncbi:hypothetical protein KZO60_01385 [Prevotella nanceiensis]|uniref:hypothetical protein n=1 Tax=Hoylesella nanceiensis TaxID=425941 RepID=UPI001C5E1D8E|nr:hypothetical protein [Hoylesella nanceiensis]MBW4766382.1 hypothetical protein [Hoylesella nanceiensis]
MAKVTGFFFGEKVVPIRIQANTRGIVSGRVFPLIGINTAWDTRINKVVQAFASCSMRTSSLY